MFKATIIIKSLSYWSFKYSSSKNLKVKDYWMYISIPTPTNKKLYEEVKAEIYIYIYISHPFGVSAALLVKTYKDRGGTYEGRKNDKEGLKKMAEWKVD